MKLKLGNNKDFWAGMMFTGIGVGALIVAQDYPLGTVQRMGPGFFPMVLGGILVLFGVYTLFRGLRSNEKIQGSWSIRAFVLLPLSMALFGVVMQTLGFIPASVALVFTSMVSGREFKFVEVLLVAVLLVGLAVGVFIWGIGLNFPLIKGL